MKTIINFKSEVPVAVVIRNLSAGYGRRTVLHGLDAHLPGPGVTAVVGPNGSGKSTLLAVLAGVVKPLSGAVSRDGGSRTGYVVQRSEAPDTLPITVRQTVAMGRWARRGAWRPLSRLDWAVVDACMVRLGIQELAGRQLGALSGGQRQRTLLAQGLAQEPDLLLLDEPATGLDVEAQQHISDVLDEMRANGTTVIHATHDLRMAERADHCLLLDQGRLAAEGTPSEVLSAQRVPPPTCGRA
ncbi:zinc ABC transporter ATP-binding protein AztA [Nonomuraea endophytica]|uniref:Zinc/manganese transport system ATP-binding protein n=1 Tax=Nonomuraea endophytica TaxID=714136 RepID=A0A7W8EIC8_9ACTN|nr:zinc ABC transporter ATP-binding protein AztA [Nonomuraea endophytica]MBB5079512.1 zinc/manganese transport system ATP-binding protein [Nonomuraea endophytica]